MARAGGRLCLFIGLWVVAEKLRRRLDAVVMSVVRPPVFRALIRCHINVSEVSNLMVVCPVKALNAVFEHTDNIL